MSFAGMLRSSLLGLKTKDLAPVTSLFAGTAVQDRLGAIVQSFADGYNLALEIPDLPTLAQKLDAYHPERAGFAWEGAGMGIAVRVMMVPTSTLLSEFLRSYGDRHHYIIQVGAGWAMARVPIRHQAMLDQLDPTYGWLAWDGLGFHETVFRPDYTLNNQKGRPQRQDYAPHGYDQGIGRATWFVAGADPIKVAAYFAKFPAERQPDLWGGVGLAAGYAGGVSDPVLESLAQASGPFRHHMGVGTLLAQETRHRAGNPAPHTDRAVRVLCRLEPEAALAQTHAEMVGSAVGPAGYPELRSRLAAMLRQP